MFNFLLILQVTSPLTKVHDGAMLDSAARAFSVPPVIMRAVAWEESRTGERGNRYLGPGKLLAVGDTAYKRVCREIGRMQIAPCLLKNGKIHPVDWSFLGAFCLRDSLKVYWANLRCGAAILRHRYRLFGSWPVAVLRYNGSKEYLARVSRNVGLTRMEELCLDAAESKTC